METTVTIESGTGFITIEGGTGLNLTDDMDPVMRTYAHPPDSMSTCPPPWQRMPTTVAEACAAHAGQPMPLVPLVHIDKRMNALEEKVDTLLEGMQVFREGLDMLLCAPGGPLAKDSLKMMKP